MKTYGDIDFLQNQIQKVAFELETNFPAVPVVGRVVFKDKVLYICVDITGTPVWIPMTNEISTYIHTQGAAATTWIIPHNLDVTTPTVQVYRQSDNTMIIPDDVTVTTNNEVQVTFGVAESGRAIVVVSNQDGNERPAQDYEHTQTIASDTWTINHNLGYHPVIRVFVGASEIIPETITHTDNFTTVITFSGPQVGTARAS